MSAYVSETASEEGHLEDEQFAGNYYKCEMSDDGDFQSHATYDENDQKLEKKCFQFPETFKFYIDDNDWKSIKPSKKTDAKRRRLRGN